MSTRRPAVGTIARSGPLTVQTSVTSPGAAQVMASWQTVFRGIQVAQGEAEKPFSIHISALTL